MKKVIASIFIVLALVGGTFVLKDKLFPPRYADGIWEGEYQSDDGENTKVILTLKDNKIVACVLEARDAMGRIKAEQHGSDGTKEDFRRAQKAVREMKKYPGMLLEVQNVDKLDCVSGATITWRAMQYAVHDALDKAR